MNTIYKNRLKLNILIIIKLIMLGVFILLKGDKYIANLLIDNKKNIVGINIKNPFLEEEEEEKVIPISYEQPILIGDSNNWYWPTTNNYTITTYYSSYHNAIDIYSYDGYGSNIYAANNGTIAEVGANCYIGDLSCNGRMGNYIMINHNNDYYTIYMHLSEINVNKGDTVTKGSIIGKMGNTGNVIPAPTSNAPYNGTHLHFVVYKGIPYNGGYTINPLNLY